ncbi:MAG TPA: membrane protein insertion efficiency factor YidD [Methylocella sp.]|nr:membrane protein insertion efficiency factor YidD [Methylocella sp.]
MRGPKRAAEVSAHVLIRAYQLSLSSLVGMHCRHLPSCSAYMDEAITRHGLWAGVILGLGRLCRCHPWGSEGFDPVPEVLPPEARWWQPWSFAPRSPHERREAD